VASLSASFVPEPWRSRESPSESTARSAGVANGMTVRRGLRRHRPSGPHQHQPSTPEPSIGIAAFADPRTMTSRRSRPIRPATIRRQ
jgi:hypothetical protein